MYSLFAEKAAEGIFNMKLTKKTAAIGVCILFAVLMLPIVITCFYTYPVLDDYNFSVHSHWAVLDGESVLIAALENAHSFYMNWQGSYTANFVAGMQPFIYNVQLYFLSNFAVLFLVTSAFLVTFYVILCRCFHCSRTQWLLFTLPLVMVFWEFIPCLSEGLYWMDGSLNIAFQSIFYLGVSAMVLCFLTKGKNQSGWAAAACAASVFLSGGGYTNLVFYVVVSVGAFVLLQVHKSPKKWIIIVQCFVILTGCMVSYFAPGTIRRTEELEGMPLLKAVLMAIWYGFVYFGKWMEPTLIGSLIFGCAILYPTLRRCSFQFRWPLVGAILCFGFYCGGMSITLLAKGNLGADRQYNMYYFSFVMSMGFLAVYLTGWLAKHCPNLMNFYEKRWAIPFAALCGALVLSGCVLRGIHSISTVDTAWGLYKGYTQEYAAQMQRRIDILEDPEVTDAELEPLTIHPNYLIPEPLSEDSDFWTNVSTAAYYRKNSVQLVHSERQ